MFTDTTIIYGKTKKSKDRIVRIYKKGPQAKNYRASRRGAFLQGFRWERIFSGEKQKAGGLQSLPRL